VKPAARRALVVVLRTEHGLSERCVCGTVGLQRSVYHYVPRPNADGPIREIALGAGLATTGTRLRQVVQALAADGSRLEPQTGPLHLLQPKAERKDERSKDVCQQDLDSNTRDIKETIKGGRLCEARITCSTISLV
jgi:hypothetical protein